MGNRQVRPLHQEPLFGLFISATCCCIGLSVGCSSTEIPQAATRAVMTSLFAVFLLDGLITWISSLSVS
jgi:phospholipid/cholesterol/gamma-HCH transport system permease protein